MKELTFKGVTKRIAEWAHEYDIPYRVLHGRLTKNWDVERALTTPADQFTCKKTPAQQTKEALCKMSLKVIESNPKLWQAKLTELAENDFADFLRLVQPLLPKEPTSKSETGQAKVHFITDPTAPTAKLRPLGGK